METVTLNFWDWVTIIVFLAGTVGIGLYFTRRGGKDLVSYFVSNRSLPWYIAGVSIIATNFASDTPLWVSSLVRQYGIQTIWQYWAPLIGGALCAVLFARLWRRMGVITDIEFLELRYQGRTAAILRFWLGASGAMIICPLIISWVTKAMATIAQEVMGIPPEYRAWTTAAVLAIGLLTCVFSGLYGVVYTDLIQFLAAGIGTISRAVLAVDRVGGLSSMLEQLGAMPNWGGEGAGADSPDWAPGGGEAFDLERDFIFWIVVVRIFGGGAAYDAAPAGVQRQPEFLVCAHAVYFCVFCRAGVALDSGGAVLDDPDTGPGSGGLA